MKLEELSDLQKDIESKISTIGYLIKEKESVLRQIQKKYYISLNGVGFSEESILGHFTFDSSDIDKEITKRKEELVPLQDRLNYVEKLLAKIKD